MKRRFLTFLILLDLFMAISATYVDFSDFFAVPWFLIPFVPICPIYPLLLAILFWKYKKSGTFSQPLLHFALIGTIGYGVMAYIFYPTFLITKGFAWYELGNMFWVTLYASQAFLLIPFLKKIQLRWYVPIVTYFFIKDVLDRFGETFSYHREQVFSVTHENFFFVSILGLHLGAFLLILWRSRSPKTFSQLAQMYIEQ